MNAIATAASMVRSPSVRRFRRPVGGALAAPGPIKLSVLTAVVGLAGAILISGTPSLRFAYPAGLSRTATQTAVAVMALLTLSLLLSRTRGRSSGAHRYLCAAVALLAAAAVAQMLARIDTGIGVWWVIYASTLAGGVLLVLSGWGADGGRRTVAAVSLVVLGLAVVAVHALAEGPVPLADMAILDAEQPHLDRQPGMLAIHLSCGALFALAAVGLARRAAGTGESLAGWVAVAASFEAVARLYLLLFPPVPTGWLHTADVWYLGSAVVMLAGVAAWSRQALVASERRRIANTLHDGVAQELAFIRRHAEELGGNADEGVGHAILAAARRADEETRSAMGMLAPTAGEGLVREIERIATRAAEREGVSLELALAPTAEARREVSEALARITGEAVTNAARHGHAQKVRVELSNRRPLRLNIADDGHGFDPESPPAAGHGLVSMRERAEQIGARLALVSGQGAGTEVRVELP